MSYNRDFTCFAVNKDVIYYLHTSKRLQGRGSITTLAKSAQPPKSGSLGSSWTIVSTTTNPDILRANDGTDGYVDDTDCHVDRNGVFNVFFYRTSMGVSIRYSPVFDTPLDLGINSTDTTLGYWSAARLFQPMEAAESMELLIQPEDNTSGGIMDTRDIVTVYYQAESKTTIFQYTHVMSTGFNINIAESGLSQVQMVRSKTYMITLVSLLNMVS